jgi:hypothetical protein
MPKTEAAHTPGPLGSIAIVLDDDSARLMRAEGMTPEMAAVCLKTNDTARQQLAAARDLVAACEALIDCQQEKATTAFNMRYDTACQIARAAIAKAKGDA